MKKETKQAALWLDHSQAHLFGYREGESYLIETIESPLERKPRIEGEGNDTTRFGANYYSNNEDRKHNKMQNELASFFSELEGKLKDFDEILLFGPTNAKEQLFNRLSENKSYVSKTFSVESVGKLTENQTLAYVRDFFKALSA